MEELVKLFYGVVGMQILVIFFFLFILFDLFLTFDCILIQLENLLDLQFSYFS